MKIIFVINYCKNHQSIINDGSGASEFLFYQTAKSLADDNEIIIYNREESKILDNINYRFLPNNLNPEIEKHNNCIVIVQRHFNQIIDIHKRNPSNKYFLWSHDYLDNIFDNLSQKYTKNEINEYFKNNNISIIAVSNFHKSNLKDKFPDIKVDTIYNALFPQHFIKHDINYDENKIIFASSWSKGLDNVLRIGKEYYKKNRKLQLIIIKPDYCKWEPDLSEYPFIINKGSIKNKNEYCKLIQGCLCVLSTTFHETFGCVFAESLHLGVPVIGNNEVNSAISEIVEPNFMCNYKNVDEVIDLIENVKRNRPNIKLDNKFYQDNVINEWIKILNS